MRYIKILIIFLLLFMGLVTIATAQQSDILPNPTITVEGNSQLEVIPDQAQVSIGVVTTAPTAESAQKANARLAALVQSKLMEAGVSKEKIHTIQYAVYPIHQQQPKSDDPPSIIGYRVNHTVIATIDDIAKIGSIIDTALSAGANQIMGIQFKKQDELQLKCLALQNAAKEATAKAEAIAAALGKRLTKVVKITETGVSVHSPEYQQRYLLKTGDAPTTPILAGSIQVNGSVSITYEIN